MELLWHGDNDDIAESASLAVADLKHLNKVLERIKNLAAATSSGVRPIDNTSGEVVWGIE